MSIVRSRRWRDPPASANAFGSDNVLLQIALAFTIILGYLLSDGLSTQENLADRLEQSEQEKGRYRGALDNISKTPAGKNAVRVAVLEEEIQRLKLLSAWNDIKPHRQLRRYLDSLGNVATIHLAREHGYLPDDPRYRELLEAARVFPPNALPDSVSRLEVSSLLQKAWGRVQDFDQRGQEKAVTAATTAAFALLPPAQLDRAELLSFNPKVPLQVNLRFVADLIRRDLEEERLQLVMLQLRLVERIALARLSDQPEGTGQSDARQLLRELVSEFKEPLGLLAEVEEQLLRNA
jgi:hypothetical protein